MTTKPDLPVMAFATRAELEAWLDENHAASEGIRLKLAKKGSGIDSVSHSDAIDVALCYGWIDSQASKLDDACWLLRFTPRRTKSKWSQVNRTRVQSLIETGRMTPAGMREIERAKADGRWDAAYAPPSTATVPEDLQRELESNDAARAFFETLDSRNRYAILYRLQDAKRPETRKRRIEKFITMLSKGETVNPS